MTAALQNLDELARFVEIIRQEGVTRFLEVGSKFGGTFKAVVSAMPKGSRVVSVDLPNGTRAWQESGVSLQNVVSGLVDEGYDARLIWGDSTAPEIVRKVSSFGPYDAVLIDANHTMPFVERDWANYSAMTRKLVAFHDISWHRAPEWKGIRIDVPQFWDALKADYRHEEIRFCPTGKNNGIGVVFFEEPSVRP